MNYPNKYNELYDEANQAVTRTVRSVLSKSSAIVNLDCETEDCTQSIWLAAWLALEQGKDITGNWMNKVAHRAASNYRRGAQFEQGLFAFSIDEPVIDSQGEETSFLDSHIPAGALDRPDTRPARLMEALKDLPVGYGEVLFEHYQHEQPLQAIADQLGISLSAATMRLSRARIAAVRMVGPGWLPQITCGVV